MTISGLLLIVLLFFDGLMALARSAFVNSRLSQLRSMDEAGVAGAGQAAEVLSQASRLILSLRLTQSLLRLAVIGLTMAAFLPAPERTSNTYGMMFAILLGSGLLIGLLEFSGERLALRSPEVWAIRLRRLVGGSALIFAPLAWLLQRIARKLGPASEDGHPLVTEEEIMTLVDAGEEEGVIEEEEKAMIYSIFQLDNTLAREVMIPRIDILAFDQSTSLDDATDELLRSGHSRAPVYASSIDNVVGLIYIKDLLAAWRAGNKDCKIGELMREAYFVPEAKKLDDLLAEMQAKRIHMAVVVDEYGGTAGVVTIEDIVEEIVGEILDEYDFAEESPYERLGKGEYRFSGGIDIDDVNQITGANLSKENSETLGGFIYSELGRVPSPGEVLEAGGLRLIVEEIIGRRIHKVRGRVLPQEVTEQNGNGNDNRAAD